MPVPELIRDSFIGQLVYYGSGRRLFQYPEDQPNFALPIQHQKDLSGSNSETATLADQQRSDEKNGTVTEKRESTVSAVERPPLEESTVGQEVLRSPSRDVEKGRLAEEQRRFAEEFRKPNLVHWYGPEDQENPQNWSFLKKCFVTFDICLLTFSIYIGSAIYAPGIEALSLQFGVSPVAGTLGLTLFVVGYGVGPMFLSPLSEIPQLGRTTVYIVSLLIFVVLQVPTALSKNLGALLPLRFLAGFVGSPALATGGASLIDMWAAEDWAIVIGLWSLAAVCGPVLGPLIGGFAAQAEGWTWTIWILLWLSGAALAFLAFLLPETSAQAILYRRATRLRRLTGNPDLRSQGELDSAHLTVSEMTQTALIRPFVLSFTEPIVACWNLYIALVYGILYIFIESFRVVFMETHGFNIGENGLAFLGLFVGAVAAYIGLLPYAILKLKPMFKNGPENFIPESRLPIAMVGAIFLPVRESLSFD
ncbi:hypothetical protein EW026_g3708 [Hermanssonia centrifuga]|uniref:Major facilitator superfamily (MFS) profile domain-containing protein n=1 Tax=Hermanssonia centrifuga TaxID=98765 RepID=A0A4S4KKE6_9APHY|nr:hypothetical protein EW026_g3708 [Hermanssonia centrifuga]